MSVGFSALGSSQEKAVSSFLKKIQYLVFIKSQNRIKCLFSFTSRSLKSELIKSENISTGSKDSLSSSFSDLEGTDSELRDN